MKTNIIYNQDCLDLMKSLLKESIDLIYIDPPFFTQRDFGEYTDKWNSIKDYIDWLSVRIKEMHRLLNNTGSIMVHCDWHASHLIRCELDKIFGYDKFINEIIWSYLDQGAGRNVNYYKRKHDNIYWYFKKENKKYNIQRTKLSKSTENRYKRLLDKYDGEPTWQNLKDFNPTSFQSQIRANRVPKDMNKVFLSRSKGSPLNDCWNDIIPLSFNGAKITRFYPTQKPIKLLNRLITTATNEGDLVGDFFCGSGTTLVSAYNNNRKYIGCDINKNAIKIANKRLQQLSLYD